MCEIGIHLMVFLLGVYVGCVFYRILAKKFKA